MRSKLKFSASAFVLLVWFAVCTTIVSHAANGKASTSPASASQGKSADNSTAAVLPDEFSGWAMKGAAERSTDPAVADVANAAVLKEYGFVRFEKAAYTRDDRRNLTVRAAVFEDASGAYGAFTFYRTADMQDETVGGQAAFLNNRLLFVQGNVLVDAVFDRTSVMSASQLRQLAGLLPQAQGGKNTPPSLPAHLPKNGSEVSLERGTTKYVLGPVALDQLGAPLTSTTVNFKAGAEVVTAKYSIAAGDATLMLIEYPTPQIAAERLREIDASHKVTPPQPGVAPILDIGPFFDARTGPIVVIAAGPLSKSEARALMAPISYEADITWNENTYVSKKDNLANFLFNAILLCGIVVGLALVAGLAFGGFRVMVKKLFPDSVFDRPEAVEFISLHLEDAPESASRKR